MRCEWCGLTVGLVFQPTPAGIACDPSCLLVAFVGSLTFDGVDYLENLGDRGSAAKGPPSDPEPQFKGHSIV